MRTGGVPLEFSSLCCDPKSHTHTVWVDESDDDVGDDNCERFHLIYIYRYIDEFVVDAAHFVSSHLTRFHSNHFCESHNMHIQHYWLSESMNAKHKAAFTIAHSFAYLRRVLRVCGWKIICSPNQYRIFVLTQFSKITINDVIMLQFVNVFSLLKTHHDDYLRCVVFLCKIYIRIYLNRMDYIECIVIIIRNRLRRHLSGITVEQRPAGVHEVVFCVSKCWR